MAQGADDTGTRDSGDMHLPSVFMAFVASLLFPGLGQVPIGEACRGLLYVLARIGVQAASVPVEGLGRRRMGGSLVACSWSDSPPWLTRPSAQGGGAAIVPVP